MNADPSDPRKAAAANLPASTDSAPLPEGGAPAPDTPPLTPEEQMERFEQELKETDWGHQPC